MGSITSLVLLFVCCGGVMASLYVFVGVGCRLYDAITETFLNEACWCSLFVRDALLYYLSSFFLIGEACCYQLVLG